MLSNFNVNKVFNTLRHYLPAQAPLKDFVHHNTLHAFQELPFFEALRKSAEIFGNRTLLSLKEYKAFYDNGRISDESILSIITSYKSKSKIDFWKDNMFKLEDPEFFTPRIGQFRTLWKTDYGIDMDGMVRPNFIRLVNAYLDQGIAFEGLPHSNTGLLNAVIHLQKNSYSQLFYSKRVIDLLYKKEKNIEDLLNLIVGNHKYFELYLLDQQFTHPGLSGLVCAIEKKPDSLYVNRPIALFDFIYLELLFELQALESSVNLNFKPLAIGVEIEPLDIFRPVHQTLYWDVLELWQRSFELMYHDQVLAGIQFVDLPKEHAVNCQAFFCIDDREESIRRNIETVFPECQTFGTPAHFNIIARFKPENAKFSTQICPGPFTPTHLIKEENRTLKYKTDIHFQNNTHHVLTGFLVSQTVGFWSTTKLFFNLFNPKQSAGHYNAPNDHMDYASSLVFENHQNETEDGYQVGFTVLEMTTIVKEELSNTGLTKDFSNLIYFFGHGGSSTNNPYFAGYNCGACSGRPSTVNARLFAIMANRKDVRKALKSEGICIPNSTHFIGGYHDTTQDTFVYFDEKVIPNALTNEHNHNKQQFLKALDNNAKERARQFLGVDLKKSAKKVHQKVKNRALSLFEPRPEYNHSNNALFIVGDRKMTQNLFLDQRAFLNSYDYKADVSGEKLTHILNAGTGVCGGINLEYFFSRVDNEKLGAGSKLPQNVVGLYGVANGVKGDLRPGLPWQMIDVHDPIRILTIVQQDPNLVLSVLKANPKTMDWYAKDWMKFVVFNPFDKKIYQLVDGLLKPYKALYTSIDSCMDFESLFEQSSGNLPVYQLSNR